MCLSRSYLPGLRGTEFSARLAVAIGSSFLFCWGIFQALNLTLSWEGEQLVSKVPLASAPPSSRSQRAAVGCTPQPSSTSGAGAPGRHLREATWHSSATTKGTSSWGPLQMPPLHPSPHPPFAKNWKMLNVASLILRRILISNTTGIRSVHGLTPEMTWLNEDVLLSPWSSIGMLHSSYSWAVVDFLDHFNWRTEGLQHFK